MIEDFSSGAEKTHLEPWEEMVGEFVSVERNDDFVNVLLRSVGKVFRLEYPRDSEEATILESELEEMDEGKKVGILRTDLSHDPLRVRIEGNPRGQSDEERRG